jgi:hypothetical protein
MFKKDIDQKKILSSDFLSLDMGYVFQNHSGVIVNIVVQQDNNTYEIHINGKDQKSNQNYHGYAKYYFDHRNNELLIKTMSSKPNRSAMGSLLIYLMAKQAIHNDCTSMRTLSTAPTAQGFYKSFGFTDDPKIRKEKISYIDEETKETKIIYSTLELVIEPSICIQKYEKNPKWSENKIETMILQYYNNKDHYHEKNTKKEILDLLMEKILLTDRKDKKFSSFCDVYLMFLNLNLNDKTEIESALQFLDDSSKLFKASSKWYSFSFKKENDVSSLLQGIIAFLEHKLPRPG